ncbi:MAG: tRNA(Ile)-lysidine synthetase [Candidatus Rokuibacteriota bacterium]|nr:MAG: tRNA(Ile)-lysidine synthetase [Candidatus Rokubacteria bacterium]
MKCKKCGGRAVLELRRHNAAFCADDFLGFFRHHVLETVRRWKMLARDERVLIAVSGGKDSLALWDVLHAEGYRTAGLYIDLGIFAYSTESRAKCEAFARDRDVPLVVVSVRAEVGAAIPDVRERTRRPACSACGLSKRYIMNRSALEGGYDVVATGHNLDDEAATLLGSTLRWDESALARQSPVLEATHPKLVRRVKPLFRLSERETAAYAFLRGIDYIVEECPFARGATSITHKEALNRLEDASPGTKAAFFLSFLERARGRFQALDGVTLTECVRCGQTTTGEVCAFCKLGDQVRRNQAVTPRAADSTAGGTVATARAPLAPGPDAGGGDVEPTDPPDLRGLIADLAAQSEIHAS